MPLTSLGTRFGDALLSTLLMAVTLVVGYLVWTVIEWKHSRTPAKRILGITVVDKATGEPADWNRMALRGFVGLLISAAGAVTFGIAAVVDACFVFTAPRTRLLDRMVGTYVSPAGAAPVAVVAITAVDRSVVRKAFSDDGVTGTVTVVDVADDHLRVFLVDQSDLDAMQHLRSAERSLSARFGKPCQVEARTDAWLARGPSIVL